MAIMALVRFFESNIGKLIEREEVFKGVPEFAPLSHVTKGTIIKKVKNQLAAKGLVLAPNVCRGGGWTVLQATAAAMNRASVTTTTTTTTTVPEQVPAPQSVPVVPPQPAKKVERRGRKPVPKQLPVFDFVDKLMLTQCMDTLTALTETYNKMVTLTLKETLERLGVDMSTVNKSK